MGERIAGPLQESSSTRLREARTELRPHELLSVKRTRESKKGKRARQKKSKRGGAAKGRGLTPDRVDGKE